jgi:hypothetical protein
MEQHHNHKGRVRSLQAEGIHEYNEVNNVEKQNITKSVIIIYPL